MPIGTGSKPCSGDDRQLFLEVTWEGVEKWDITGKRHDAESSMVSCLFVVKDGRS